MQSGSGEGLKPDLREEAENLWARRAATPPVCVTQHTNKLREDEALQNQGETEGEDQGYGNDSKRSKIFHTYFR